MNSIPALRASQYIGMYCYLRTMDYTRCQAIGYLIRNGHHGYKGRV